MLTSRTIFTKIRKKIKNFLIFTFATLVISIFCVNISKAVTYTSANNGQTIDTSTLNGTYLNLSGVSNITFDNSAVIQSLSSNFTGIGINNSTPTFLGDVNFSNKFSGISVTNNSLATFSGRADLDNITSSAIAYDSSTLNFNNIVNITSSGTGIFSSGSGTPGTANFAEDVTISNNSAFGVLLIRGSVNFFKRLDISGAGYGISTDVFSSSSGSFFGPVTIDGSDNGIRAESTNFTFHDSLVVTNNTLYGIRCGDSATCTFNSVTSTDNGDNGIELNLSNSVVFNGETRANDNGNHGIRIDDIPSVTFNDFVRGNRNINDGININNVPSVTFGSTVRANDNTNNGININVVPLFVFNDAVTANRNTNNGIEITNSTGTFTGSVTLNDNAKGLIIDNSATTFNNTIDVSGGIDGINLNNTTSNINFVNTVTVDGSTNYGVQLSNSSATFGQNVSVDNASNGSTGYGLNIINNSNATFTGPISLSGNQRNLRVLSGSTASFNDTLSITNGITGMSLSNTGGTINFAENVTVTSSNTIGTQMDNSTFVFAKGLAVSNATASGTGYGVNMLNNSNGTFNDSVVLNNDTRALRILSGSTASFNDTVNITGGSTGLTVSNANGTFNGSVSVDNNPRAIYSENSPTTFNNTINITNVPVSGSGAHFLRTGASAATEPNPVFKENLTIDASDGSPSASPVDAHYGLRFDNVVTTLEKNLTSNRFANASQGYGLWLQNNSNITFDGTVNLDGNTRGLAIVDSAASFNDTVNITGGQTGLTISGTSGNINFAENVTIDGADTSGFFIDGNTAIFAKTLDVRNATDNGNGSGIRMINNSDATFTGPVILTNNHRPLRVLSGSSATFGSTVDITGGSFGISLGSAGGTITFPENVTIDGSQESGMSIDNSTAIFVKTLNVSNATSVGNGSGIRMTNNSNATFNGPVMLNNDYRALRVESGSSALFNESVVIEGSRHSFSVNNSTATFNKNVDVTNSGSFDRLNIVDSNVIFNGGVGTDTYIYVSGSTNLTFNNTGVATPGDSSVITGNILPSSSGQGSIRFEGSAVVENNIGSSSLFMNSVDFYTAGQTIVFKGDLYSLDAPFGTTGSELIFEKDSGVVDASFRIRGSTNAIFNFADNTNIKKDLFGGSNTSVNISAASGKVVEFENGLDGNNLSFINGSDATARLSQDGISLAVPVTTDTIGMGRLEVTGGATLQDPVGDHAGSIPINKVILSSPTAKTVTFANDVSVKDISFTGNSDSIARFTGANVDIENLLTDHDNMGTTEFTDHAEISVDVGTTGASGKKIKAIKINGSSPKTLTLGRNVYANLLEFTSNQDNIIRFTGDGIEVDSPISAPNSKGIVEFMGMADNKGAIGAAGLPVETVRLAATTPKTVTFENKLFAGTLEFENDTDVTAKFTGDEVVIDNIITNHPNRGFLEFGDNTIINQNVGSLANKVDSIAIDAADPTKIVTFAGDVHALNGLSFKNTSDATAKFSKDGVVIDFPISTNDANLGKIDIASGAEVKQALGTQTLPMNQVKLEATDDAKIITFEDNVYANEILFTGNSNATAEFSKSEATIDTEINTSNSGKGNLIISDAATILKDIGKNLPLNRVDLTLADPLKEINLAANINANEVKLGPSIFKFANDLTLKSDSINTIKINNSDLDLGDKKITFDGNVVHESANGIVKVRSLYDGTKNGHIEQIAGVLDLRNNVDSMTITLTETPGVPVPVQGVVEQIPIFVANGGNIVLPQDSDVTTITPPQATQIIQWGYSDGVITKQLMPQEQVVDNAVNDVNNASSGDDNLELAIDNLKKIINDFNDGAASKFGQEFLTVLAQQGGAAALDILNRIGNPDEASIATAPLNHVVQSSIDVVSSRSDNFVGSIANFAKSNDQTLAGVSAGDAENKYGIWVSPFYGYSSQKDRSGAPGNHTRYHGAVFGMDSLISDDLVIGGAVTLLKTNIRYKGINLGDKTTANGYIASLYGIMDLTDRWFVKGIGAFGLNNVENQEVRNGILRVSTAKAKYNSGSWGVEISTGYKHKTNNNFLITPIAGVEYNRLNSIKYTEEGTDFKNLSIKRKAVDKFNIILGSKLSWIHNFGCYDLVPEIHGILHHDLIGKKLDITVAQEGLVSDSFSTKSAKTVRTVANLGSSLNLSGPGILEYSLGYDLRLANKFISHQGMMKLKLKF